ncbi:uncharacterized protein LOC131948292 [Physella acuta]|uniref:uncharacterized protein LOC131948292 n=1 Tax=Physella acuta TaxID=109671 RepID=UPI0027DBAB19|nr:uncharacterized protein LOC131948292 [Physella acuta]
MLSLGNLSVTKSLLLALVMCLSVNSFPQMSGGFGAAYTQNDDVSQRSKRYGYISCHCCSNSFNSNCCFQCMKSLGLAKRSAPNDVMTPWEQPRASFDWMDADLDPDFMEDQLQ